MYKYASITKIADSYGVPHYEAVRVYSFFEELEKCGSITEMEKHAFFNKVMAQMAVKMPKTFAAATGASSHVSNAMVNNPLFNQAMAQGDLLGMGMTASAGALKGLAGFYKKAPKRKITGGIPLKKVSKSLDTAAPLSSAGQLAQGASKHVDKAENIVDLFSNAVELV